MNATTTTSTEFRSAKAGCIEIITINNHIYVHLNDVLIAYSERTDISAAAVRELDKLKMQEAKK